MPTSEQLAAGEKDGQDHFTVLTAHKRCIRFCVFVWDYFMNLPKEIECIWKKKFSYVSVLYILNRYYGLLQFAVSVPLYTTPITHAISIHTCLKMILWQPIGAQITTIISHIIMGARVYALYDGSKIILMILGLLMVAEYVVQSISMTVFIPAPSPMPEVTFPCVATGPTRWLIAFWVMPLIYDTVTFAMTLLKSVEHWRNQVSSSTLSLLFRDGLIYFSTIFTMNLINVVLFVTQNPNLKVINIPSTSMLNVIMSCRLILNLREPRPTAIVDDQDSNPDSFQFERNMSMRQLSAQQASYQISKASIAPSGRFTVKNSADNNNQC
ncbi:hypothetical protein BDQ12DRAFT_739019 [Crucibulum laeve]|uniref:DUF6533 domain-containing protein n=1 Tax=Crucibulum laeve TaxID=68775 RepID=A0A5C3LKC2_9AGAR|nr:hypothetical protein BDQ12DRAFT_739019 [Crucibulum laeve]